MNVVLINPPVSVDSDQTSGEEVRFFPEGLAVVAAALLNAGHDVRVIDMCTQQGLNLEVCHDVEVFGITGMINQFAYIERLIPQLRELNPKAKILLGGPLITCASELISRFLDFELAIVGEGEQSVTKLLEEARPSTISAATYLDPRDFLLPAFGLFNLSWYLEGINRTHLNAAGVFGKTINNLMVSRGCPRLKNCDFCGQFFGHAIRCKPLRLVEQELLAWVGAGASIVRFQDDNLTLLPVERQEQFYDLVGRLGLAWSAHSRVDAVNPLKLQRMKEAGCKILYFGLESFSDQALLFVDKGATVTKARDAVTMTQDAGIRPAAFFILGLPGETRESLRTAIQFVRRHQVLVTPYILCPIPGTPLFELARPQIPDIRDYLRSCSGWESRQLAEGKLIVNLTDLPDELLLETYRELMELGKR